MRRMIRTYKCVQCFRRFLTHAELNEAARICPVCRVIEYTPPPPPIREPVPPSEACLRGHKITRDDWLRMAREQGGLCAICRRYGWQYVVDHNHRTGEVRGLLCHYAGLAPRATRLPEGAS